MNVKSKQNDGFKNVLPYIFSFAAKLSKPRFDQGLLGIVSVVQYI